MKRGSQGGLPLPAARVGWQARRARSDAPYQPQVKPVAELNGWIYGRLGSNALVAECTLRLVPPGAGHSRRPSESQSRSNRVKVRVVLAMIFDNIR
jgi:hypothetical protein